MASISQTGGDLSRHLQLYKAALRGDWDTAQDLYRTDKELITAIIGSRSQTALHVAVSTGKANDFVNKLVELMPPHALALKDSNECTALHVAAWVGNKEATIALVNKNEDLLYILNKWKIWPVTQAAVRGQKKTLEYLISFMESKPKVEHKPFEGERGTQLLTDVIWSEFFDVALDLVEKYPHLARSKHEPYGFALSKLADKNSVFLSGERFNWWQRLIYRCIPLKQPKRKAARATSAAGDIENASRNAPVYKKLYSGSFQIILGVAQKLEFMLWKVVENLVPQVKGIKEKKAVHQQALKLVKRLCQEMVSLPQNEATIMFKSSIIKATKYGISEIVEEILEMYPEAIYSTDPDTVMDIFHLAASYRNENVFNLIYNMSDQKYMFFDNVDNKNNNFMHTCGKLAPPHKLNLVPGAALQMQRELQWFKEAEKYVTPSRRTGRNGENQTPQMLFTKEHEKLKVEGEKWMKDTTNACTIAAALIATVVFASIFTVPGGLASDTGIPIFLDQSAFVLFAISDAISLFTSITSLLMFLSILTSRYAEEDFLYVLPKRLSIGLLSLFVSITFMMAAFSATLYLVLRGTVSWFLIPVAAFACLPVTSFVLLQFPLLVDVVYSTFGPGIFGKKSDRILY